MKKTFRSIMALCAAAVLTVPFSLSAAAVTEFSDGIYTFSKTENGAAVITDCSLTESDIVVPGSVLGYPVTGIGNYAFLNNSYIRSVSLPGTVSSIGKYAFAENKNLKTVVIPNMNTVIADNAFFNSPGVTVHCLYGSTADSFAKKNSLPCEYIDSAFIGDANGDGVIRITDVTAIQLHLANINVLEGINLLAADVDQKGSVNISDATALQRFLAEYDVSSYHIGEPIIADNNP